MQLKFDSYRINDHKKIFYFLFFQTKQHSCKMLHNYHSYLILHPIIMQYCKKLDLIKIEVFFEHEI